MQFFSVVLLALAGFAVAAPSAEADLTLERRVSTVRTICAMVDTDELRFSVAGSLLTVTVTPTAVPNMLVTQRAVSVLLKYVDETANDYQPKLFTAVVEREFSSFGLMKFAKTWC